MANPEHVAKLKEGVEAWNEWRMKESVAANLSAETLSDLDLRNANFQGASLQGADLSRANLEGANLSNANFVGATLRAANFGHADLRRADPSHADLRLANLSEANLEGADLGAAILSQANLRGAHLSWANLVHADLVGARLSGATLCGAHFSFANLSHADLREADINKADFLETVFGATNLTGCIGLHSCRHLGPSFVDHATLVQSGMLPRPFLRGCGLPDNLIEYLPSLLNQPIQFYSCFISYSSEDQEFADRLHADLQNKGVRCWFAPHDIAAGKKIHEQIDEAIRMYDRLLLILSENSINSEWVNTEISKARRRESKEKRRMLFPVRLVEFGALQTWECFDADTGKDSAREIREYFIPDFSRWKDHDSYTKAFERLLRDLKADKSATSQGA
jgi:uncharacterized protein YjbI with pentapeptide repeats